jgi:hypothetical protein
MNKQICCLIGILIFKAISKIAAIPANTGSSNENATLSEKILVATIDFVSYSK